MMQALWLMPVCVLASGCFAVRACMRAESLCGVSQKTCEEIVETTRKVAGDPEVEALAKCYAEAETCAEAHACAAVGAVSRALQRK